MESVELDSGISVNFSQVCFSSQGEKKPYNQLELDLPTDVISRCKT